MSKCIICKAKFKATRFNQKDCGDKNCMTEYAILFMKKERIRKERLEKKKQAEEKKSHREDKIRIKSLDKWKGELQDLINLIARLIDAGQSCIATGSYEGQLQGGHYASRGSNPTIRYHLANIHIQSAHSNSWKGGDNIRYQQGIVRVYGQEYLDYMNSLQGHPTINLTIEDIREKISISRKIIKELKDLDLVYSVQERINLREKYNKILGIYKY